MTTPTIIFDSHTPDGLRSRMQCEGIVRVISADKIADVRSCIEQAQEAAEEGLYAAGFVTYEAAGAFDDHLVTHQPEGKIPPAWFAICEKMSPVAPPQNPPADKFTIAAPRSSISRDDYDHAIGEIKKLIAAGDTYQVNFTLHLLAKFSGHPMAMFDSLCGVQQAEFASFIETDGWAICCLSPELFFRMEEGMITSRPMKGTARRGATQQEDAAIAAALQNSAKNRAENAMIVDMIRNDIGRIAAPGTVRIASAFDIERYPTLFQMTSTVCARTGATTPEIFAAMFPCASITGAPKIRTMQIIRQLEQSPRGIYCGAIGWIAPGGKSQFNVAIRTVAIDKNSGLADYGVGGGIVWDSDAAGEYEECLTKAEIFLRAAAQ